MKGKQAARAANRRSTDLAEQLASERARARDAEQRVRELDSEAARVPTLLARIDELTRQVEAGTSDEVERLHGLLAEQQGELAARAKRLDLAERNVLSAFRRIRRSKHGDDVLKLSAEEYAGLAAAFGYENIRELIYRLDGKNARGFAGKDIPPRQGFTDPSKKNQFRKAQGRPELGAIEFQAARDEIAAAAGEGKHDPGMFQR